MGIKHI